MDKPNILFMHSHNTGQYVQPYGHAIPTPNMQRLAEQGVLFRNAFAANPTCSPSRASFLSGMYPHSCGMLGLAHRGFSMKDYSQHIVSNLKNAGYFTALSGVEHTAPDIDSVDYDRILSMQDTNYPDHADDPDIADAAVAFLEQPHNKPFFLSVGLNETHRPFPKADPTNYPAEDARYCTPPVTFPDTPETRADVADFKAAARIMDDAFGRVLATLDRAGLTGNTLVFCFSDHGLQFPLNMCNLTDHGTAVYCIARGPGGFTGGKVVDALISLIDLVPTAYEVAGIDKPAYVQGESLRPLVNGDVDSVHDAIYSEVNYHAAYEPQRAIRTTRYKYIRRYDNREKVVLPNADDTPSKQFLLDHGWTEAPRWQEALFDLVFDPTESNNIADRPDMQVVLAELRGRLNQWSTDTDDPILATGHVAAPSGARITPSDARSPRDPAEIMP